MTITIPEEKLQESIESNFYKVIDSGQYSNPIKSLIEKQIGTAYSKGELTEELNKKISAKINEIMERPEFHSFLGQAVANAIAQREIDKKNK